jgi:hypothetical protein
MTRLTRSFAAAALAAALLGAPADSSAAPTAAEGMKLAQYLLGTWSCAHTVGDFSGTYRETFAPAFGGRWIEQTYEFPATATEPAVHAEYFIEYDERVPRWVRFGAHSNGQYYGQFSSSTGERGWQWNYVMPGAGGGPSTWTKRSDTEYAIEGPSYPQNGKLVTEHHVCKKA